MPVNANPANDNPSANDNLSASEPGVNADDVVIIGAGPAGLTAAYVLAQRGQTCTVLEADDTVGGISRTVERDGWRFDIGGHRFFTKVKAVEDLWHEILPGDAFMVRPRMSRIYYQGKYYEYPLKPMNALCNLGPWSRCGALPPMRGRGCTHRETRALSRVGWRPVSVGACTNISSRRTRRKCGVTPVRSCKPIGRRNA